MRRRNTAARLQCPHRMVSPDDPKQPSKPEREKPERENPQREPQRQPPKIDPPIEPNPGRDPRRIDDPPAPGEPPEIIA